MAYKSDEIAEYLIFKYGQDITAMKLNKLIYIAHGYYMALTNNILIDEYVEAWKYGPVIKSLYFKYKDPLKTINKLNNKINIKDVKFLDWIWSKYGKYTAIELSRIAHKPDSPWDVIWNNNSSLDIPIIPNSIIKDYYKIRMTIIENYEE